MVLLLGCGMEVEDDLAFDRGSAAATPASDGATTCDPSRFPMDKAAPLACCMEGDDEWLIVGGGATVGNLGHRLHAEPCTLADGVTHGCTGMGCANGPCGARIVKQYAGPSHVFLPLSDPTVCGRQATGISEPEAWTGEQTPYPGVTPACPFTDCQPTGPVVTLTVTAVADAATGRVKSRPSGIDLTGAGTSAAFFSHPKVKLKARPHGRHARAVFSGACVATGAYGKRVRCKLALGPNKAVTVTYECKPGFTCPP